MKNYPIFFVLLSILLISSNFFIVSCPDDDDDDPTPTPTPTQDPNADIIPGEKLFELYVDADFSTCVDRYGEPNSYQQYGSQFICFYTDLAFGVIIDDIDSDNNLDGSDKIYYISIYSHTNWNGTTQGGNGIGSTRDEIISEFGPCEESNEDYCNYPSIGIDWGFMPDVICYSINVYRAEG